jgi:hypothetical protein
MSEPTTSGTDIATWSSSADQYLSIGAHEQRQSDGMVTIVARGNRKTGLLVITR